MYETTDDPYCYPGSTVLRNRQNLTTQVELDKFEAFITAQRAEEALPAGQLRGIIASKLDARRKSPPDGGPSCQHH